MAPTQMQIDQLATDHIGMVKAIAMDLHESVPLHVDLDDLISAGLVGLWESARAFDSARGVTFGSYVKKRVKGAMLDYLRSLDWATRDQRRLIKVYEAAVASLSADLGRAPSRVEIAEELCMTLEQLNQIIVHGGLVSLTGVGHSPANPHKDELPEMDPVDKDVNSMPDRRAESAELAEFLRDRIDESLPPRYQMVIELYYAGDMSMKEIGAVMGINESRVSQIHKTALDKLHVAMSEHGIRTATDFLHA